jgi:hypothetical protein
VPPVTWTGVDSATGTGSAVGNELPEDGGEAAVSCGGGGCVAGSDGGGAVVEGGAVVVCAPEPGVAVALGGSCVVWLVTSVT